MDVDQGYEDSLFETTVSQNFHCAICMNVLRTPVMCENNQHHFCKPCISRHLENSRRCPTCREPLTLETLKQPLRVVQNCLSELRIRCKYFANGCHEFVRLDALDSHADSCAYCPVECTNKGCSLIITKRNQEHHETVVCNFRKFTCDGCVQMRQDLGRMNDYLALVSDQVRTIRDSVIQEVRDMMAEIKVEVEAMKQTIQKPLSFSPREDILVAGGENMSSRTPEYSLNSVEIFSWHTRTWKLYPPLLEGRKGAYSFVYENQVVVCGGNDGDNATDTMEALDMSLGGEATWFHFPAKLPCNMVKSKCVVTNHRLLAIGGYQVLSVNEERIADCVCDVLLNSPFTSNLLCHMPQPRVYHGTVVVDGKVLIVGGSTSDEYEDTLSSVLMLDVNTKRFRQMAPLPFPVSGMAIVVWGDNVILFGGCDRDGVTLNSVIMYNVETEKSKMLPPMKYKRAECSAVVTGNVLVVIGGYDDDGLSLSSVEYFSLERYVWEDLPPMIERRSAATSVTLVSL